MNLIEQVGGIEKAREIVDGAPDCDPDMFNPENGHYLFSYTLEFEEYNQCIFLADIRAAIASHDAATVAEVPGQSICEKALRSITKQDVIQLIEDINRMCVDIQNAPDFTNEVIEELDKKDDELRVAAENYVLTKALNVDLDKVFTIALFLRWSQLEKDHGHD